MMLNDVYQLIQHSLSFFIHCLSHDLYFPKPALLKKPSKKMVCVGLYGFWEQSCANPYGPTRASLKKIFEQNEPALDNFFTFSSVLAHFRIGSYDRMPID